LSSEGAWEEWIAFCLAGVEHQARDTQKRCERLLELHKEFQARIQKVAKSGSLRLSAIVTALFQTPAVRVTTVAARHGVSYPTARSDLSRLQRAGILREMRGAAQITYFTPAILDIIHGQ
jgi:Fic family protein